MSCEAGPGTVAPTSGRPLKLPNTGNAGTGKPALRSENAIMDQPASGSRFERVTYWLVSTSPWAWLVLFGSFILRARLALGHWPSPYQPDPKDLGFDIHYYCTVIGSNIAVGAPALAGVMILFALVLRRTREVRYGLGALVLAVGWMTLFVLARLDPGRFFEWFAD